MKNDRKYCTMCKKVESRDECYFGPKIWDKMAVNEGTLYEKKRYKVADAILGSAFLLNVAQGSKDLVRSGHIESPGVALMQRWANTRDKAGVDYLDRGRVSHSSRNRKLKQVKEAKVYWSQTTAPLKSGWTPSEKNRAKMYDIKSRMKKEGKTPELQRRYSSLHQAHLSQSGIEPSKNRHRFRLEKLHDINVGRERRFGHNSQEKIMPSRFSRQLSSNKNRNKFYRMNLSKPREDMSESLKMDKDSLIQLIKHLVNEKKRKNYLLNYGYIGEAKTPAWTRKAGKDMVKGGLNRKGIASYRRENPGSKLSMAVTTEPSKLKKGSKSWKRRKSFCSRSAGQMKMWPKAAKDPNSRLRLARKKWNC